MRLLRRTTVVAGLAAASMLIGTTSAYALTDPPGEQPNPIAGTAGAYFCSGTARHVTVAGSNIYLGFGGTGNYYPSGLQWRLQWNHTDGTITYSAWKTITGTGYNLLASAVKTGTTFHNCYQASPGGGFSGTEKY